MAKDALKTLRYSSLIKKVAERTELSQKVVERVLLGLQHEVMDSLSAGTNVTLGSTGTFKLKTIKPRKLRLRGINGEMHDVQTELRYSFNFTTNEAFRKELTARMNDCSEQPEGVDDVGTDEKST